MLYYTGLITTENEEYPLPPYQGRGWAVEIVETPVSQPCHGMEVAIDARGEDRAQYALDLIIASHALLGGSEPTISKGCVRLSPEMPDWSSTDPFVRPFASVSTHGFPTACRLAVRLSQRHAYGHAAHKYLYSVNTACTQWIDMHPHWGDRRQKVTIRPEQHVAFAYAIVSAYSVLEELSLEIRASAKNPSMLDGAWNPKVLHDLENRLWRAGIDVDDMFLWEVRDTPTRIERYRQPTLVEPAPWANMIVRDSWIRLADAIHYASWLRSRLAAHRLSDLSFALNYVHVDNVQKLARRVLLEKFGFW